MQVAFTDAVAARRPGRRAHRGRSVGKVVTRSSRPRDNRTLATIELEPQFAPLHADAHAILRQKTLLGETYVELSRGTPAREDDQGGRAPARRQVSRPSSSTSSSGVFDKLDADGLPELAAGPGEGRRRAAGPTSTTRSATCRSSRRARNDVLDVLERPPAARRAAWSATPASSSRPSPADEAALHDRSSAQTQTFAATAPSSDALAESFQILPTFLDETKLTLARAEDVLAEHRSADPRPRPARATCTPTLADVRGLAPDLRRTFFEARPADHGVEDRPAGAARHPRGRQAAARQPRPVPRAAQPDPPVARVQPVHGRRLHLQRRGDARRRSRGPRRRRGRPLPAPVRPARAGDGRHLSERAAEQPRQRLPGRHRPGRLASRPST